MATEAWNPAAFDSPERMAEMLMFHRAVGGKRYTGLKHDPLSFLDLSHVLAEDRCMLIGKLAQPLAAMTFSEQKSSPSSQGKMSSSGQTLTLVRIVLPVRDAKEP